MKNWLILSAALALFACSAKDISYNYPHNPDYSAKARAGKFFSAQDLIIFGAKKTADSENNLENNLENSTLWKAAQLVISEFAQISTADIDGGLIASQWRQDGDNERIKINASVKAGAASTENLQITILRQKKVAISNKFEWRNIENKPDDATLAKSIQDKILKKNQ